MPPDGTHFQFAPPSSLTWISVNVAAYKRLGSVGSCPISRTVSPSKAVLSISTFSLRPSQPQRTSWSAVNKNICSVLELKPITNLRQVRELRILAPRSQPAQPTVTYGIRIH